MDFSVLSALLEKTDLSVQFLPIGKAALFRG
jgi:hypothetical protein